jgi:carbon storage regulator CsrA
VKFPQQPDTGARGRFAPQKAQVFLRADGLRGKKGANMVIAGCESTGAPGGVCRPAQMMLLDAQIHELWDALAWYQASPRRVDDQVHVLASVTLADAALRALWRDEEITQAVRGIDERLERGRRNAAGGGTPMLALTRKPGESILIGRAIRVTFVRGRARRIVRGVTAPPEVRIRRQELDTPAGQTKEREKENQKEREKTSSTNSNSNPSPRRQAPSLEGSRR